MHPYPLRVLMIGGWLWLSACLLPAQTELGGGLVFATAADEIGFHLKGRFALSPRFDLSPSVNLFVFESAGANDRYFWEVNGDVHALFDATTRLLVYPLAGLNLGVRQWRYPNQDRNRNQVRPGLNLGGGAAYYVTPGLAASSELKFVLSEFRQVVLSVGVMITL
jgi:hypothetical protein